MDNNSETKLSAAEIRDLGDIAGTMIPESATFGVPGADDPAILADIVRSAGRDLPLVREAWRRSPQDRQAPSPGWTATAGKR